MTHLLSYDLLELFITTLPDGISSILSNESSEINSLIHYDVNSMTKIKALLNRTFPPRDDKLPIAQLLGPNNIGYFGYISKFEDIPLETIFAFNKLQEIDLEDVDEIDLNKLISYDFSTVEKLDITFKDDLLNLSILANMVVNNPYSFDNIRELDLIGEYKSAGGLLKIIEQIPNIKILNIHPREDYNELYLAIENDFLRNLEAIELDIAGNSDRFANGLINHTDTTVPIKVTLLRRGGVFDNPDPFDIKTPYF